MITFDTITSALPDSKLRNDGNWLFSSQPLALDKRTAKSLTQLGHVLAQFQKASNSIYQRSVKGKTPDWIHEVLDAGKPGWLVAAQCAAETKDILPRIIRPDLILTGDQNSSTFALTELDSVPGGMGITLWLSRFYAEQGFKILGGKEGIRDGFQSLLPAENGGGRILISEESADYLPEMEWLAAQCQQVQVNSAEQDDGSESPAYRFFEWFDWENIPAARKLAQSTKLTAPCKPHLEEKLWLALLWSPSLRDVWKQELRGSHLDTLKSIVPHSWVVDPTPLPPNASLPRLDAHSWQDVANFSQKERQLVLKISGFSELAWGSRGVYIGHDMPSAEWSQEIEKAAAAYSTQPRMMQDFHQGKLIEHPYLDPETGEEKIMEGRARLCPYYFINSAGKTALGGCLATIVPADKKKIHGMKDGILVPCSI
ncbi:MAG: hypothetical protein ACSHX0_06210 [Akkermansiaceae bacterium]